jgi:diguanylate cyclase (GGDEF)-like protein
MTDTGHLPGSDERERPDDASPQRGRSRAGLLGVAAAVLCLIAGVLAATIGAKAVARDDSATARHAFARSASDLAATVGAAIQHEQDLAVSAATFFADHPTASPSEFHTWASWARVSGRYPELAELRLVMLVPAAERSTVRSQLGARPAVGTPAPSGAAPLKVVPAGERASYCLSFAGLARGALRRVAPGTDYCARTPSLLPTRDSGRSSFARTSFAGVRALRIQTPVYRGGSTPATVTGRRAAFVGWLRETIVPPVVLGRVLASQAASAVRLRYRTRAVNAVFASGSPQAGAQSATTALHDGWSVRSFGAPLATGVFASVGPAALLIGGCLASVLLSLLLLSLTRTGRRTPARQKTEEQEEAHDDLYDALTGLPRRPLTLDLAERMLARAGRQSGTLAGALIVDVDWFKDVNEKLGRSAGDQLLRTVAARLSQVVRAQDTVGRLGGDRFAILVESAARGARLDSLARRVIEAMHEPVELDDFGPGFFVTASIGVAFGRYDTPDELLRDAQLALESAKESGRDGYTMFNANMRSLIESQAVLEAELDTALQERQFFLLYQPICDLRSDAVVGFEALIRWQHPSQGILTPAEFVPAAEETGLIVPIGRWVLEEACTRAAAWNVAGHRAGVSVVVSAKQLNRDGFVTDVRRALQQSGIEPSLLTLEIAEATVMGDVAGAAERLAEVKRLGVGIAVDDFGNSYAHRSDLRRLPLDQLEVDRGRLAASEDEDYRKWLLEAILALGRDLSLKVVVKGVESEAQVTHLKEMGCTLAQGYFVGEPTASSAIETYLAARSAPAAGAGAPLAG